MHCTILTFQYTGASTLILFLSQFQRIGNGVVVALCLVVLVSQARVNMLPSSSSHMASR